MMHFNIITCIFKYKFELYKCTRLGPYDGQMCARCSVILVCVRVSRSNIYIQFKSL